MKIPSYVFMFVGVLLLIVLFFSLKPKDTVSPSNIPPKNNESQSTTQESLDTEDKKIFPIVIENGEIVSGEKVISVTQGDDVSIDILGDFEDEIHLHGYDISVNTIPGEHAKLEFNADKTGRFSFELEHAGIELGYVEVHPK